MMFWGQTAPWETQGGHHQSLSVSILRWATKWEGHLPDVCHITFQLTRRIDESQAYPLNLFICMCFGSAPFLPLIHLFLQQHGISFICIFYYISLAYNFRSISRWFDCWLLPLNGKKIHLTSLSLSLPSFWLCSRVRTWWSAFSARPGLCSIGQFSCLAKWFMASTPLAFITATLAFGACFCWPAGRLFWQRGGSQPNSYN